MVICDSLFISINFVAIQILLKECDVLKTWEIIPFRNRENKRLNIP